MAHCRSDLCDEQLNGVSEAMDLLQIDVEAYVVEGRKGRQEATCSVSYFPHATIVRHLVKTISPPK